ncbi:MAG: XRE family transcriptional regulator [Burkholderiaceae bacterium]|nr:XRE family transcriptional regulator [Burkholderiaceae bacterium]
MNTLPSTLVGARVKYAREARNLTQDRLRAALGFNDRQTVSDIETGKRAVKAEELLKLSDVLDRDVEFFVDPFTVVAEAQYSWRASPELPAEELDRFEERANGWIGVLRWLRAQTVETQPSPLKYALRLNSQSTFEQAQRHAEELVARFGLGPVPAEKLVACIEEQFDTPVLFVDTGEPSRLGAISGAACHLDEFGVILVNRRESPARRYFDLAHEFFHTLTWEAMRPEHRETNSIEDRKNVRRAEQLANNFASALLMPPAALDELIEPARAQDVRHLVEVAAKLRVSTEALSWRLFHLHRIDEATRVKLAQRKPQQVKDATPALFSTEFVRQLHVALDKGQLSARKAAKLLSLSLSELTALFTAHELAPPFEL